MADINEDFDSEIFNEVLADSYVDQALVSISVKIRKENHDKVVEKL